MTREPAPPGTSVTDLPASAAHPAPEVDGPAVDIPAPAPDPGGPTGSSVVAPVTHSRDGSPLTTGLRWVLALVGAMVVFGAFVAANGGNALQVFTDIWSTTLTSPNQLQQVAVQATPIILAALAVAVPARAGLVNVGGEGQLIVGGVACAGVARLVDQSVPGGATIALMAVAAAAAGAAWAGIAGLLRVLVGVNESVTTLLLNYVAMYLMLFLILGSWRDPAARGQSTSQELADAAKLPYLSGSTVHVGIVVALVAAAVLWWVLNHTTFGFRLRVVGGNPEAARRAGLPVLPLLLGALLLGGALAGLAGFTHFAGAEYKLRPTFGETLGYIGFLASWLARHRPLGVVVAAVALAAIAVSGNSLQIASGLPAATVNILMGLVLIAVLGWTGTRRKAAQ